MSQHAKPEAAADGAGATSASDAATAASTPNPSPARRAMQVPPQVDDSTPIDPRIAAQAEIIGERAETQRRQAKPEGFVYDKSEGIYWDIEDNTPHNAEQVDACIPLEFWRVEVTEAPEQEEGAAPRRGRPAQRRERLIQPSQDIRRVETNRLVEAHTYWPGQEVIVKDHLVTAGGVRRAVGRRLYNMYRGPEDLKGDAAGAGPWLDHLKTLWPDEYEYFVKYAAHMLQHPDVKCNAAIVLSGAQGVGKDFALHPVKQAVGMWNVRDISPDDLFSPYKPWLQCSMLVVNEARPTKDEFQASSMYNIVKPLAAAPPYTLMCNDKYVKFFVVPNVLRLYITTNNWMDLFIPEGDRRMYVMHSPLAKQWHVAAGKPSYFADLKKWFDDEGCANVQAYLMSIDLSDFDAAGECPITRGKEAVAGTWAPDLDDDIGVALAALGHPDVLFAQEFLDRLKDESGGVKFDYGDEYERLKVLLRAHRKFGRRMEQAEYMEVQNPDSTSDKDRRWRFAAEGVENGYRSAKAFARVGMSKRDAVAALRRRGEDLAAKLSARAAKGG